MISILDRKGQKPGTDSSNDKADDKKDSTDVDAAKDAENSNG